MGKKIWISILKFKYLFLIVLVFLIFNKSIETYESNTPITFKKTQIKIGNKEINVEIAQTELQLKRGLMNRTQLKEDEGMLFVFDKDQILNFWMKNTLIDLSIAYINSNYEVVDIQDMNVINLDEKAPVMYPSKSPAKYALEMNKGWFNRNNISIGDKVELKY